MNNMRTTWGSRFGIECGIASNLSLFQPLVGTRNMRAASASSGPSAFAAAPAASSSLPVHTQYCVTEWLIRPALVVVWAAGGLSMIVGTRTEAGSGSHLGSGGNC